MEQWADTDEWFPVIRIALNWFTFLEYIWKNPTNLPWLFPTAAALHLVRVLSGRWEKVRTVSNRSGSAVEMTLEELLLFAFKVAWSGREKLSNGSSAIDWLMQRDTIYAVTLLNYPWRGQLWDLFLARVPLDLRMRAVSRRTRIWRWWSGLSANNHKILAAVALRRWPLPRLYERVIRWKRYGLKPTEVQTLFFFWFIWLSKWSYCYSVCWKKFFNPNVKEWLKLDLCSRKFSFSALPGCQLLSPRAGSHLRETYSSFYLGYCSENVTGLGNYWRLINRRGKCQLRPGRIAYLERRGMWRSGDSNSLQRSSPSEDLTWFHGRFWRKVIAETESPTERSSSFASLSPPITL